MDEKPDKRPSCEYNETKSDGSKQPCGSEERLYQVSERNRWGGITETPICGKHIDKVYKEQNVDSFRPLEPTSHKPC